MTPIIYNSYDTYDNYFFSNKKPNLCDDHEEAPLLVPETKKIVDFSQIAFQKSEALLSLSGTNQKQKFMQSIKERVYRDFLLDFYTPVYEEPLLEQLRYLCESKRYEDFLYLESICEGRNLLIIGRAFQKIIFGKTKDGSNEKFMIPNVYKLCSTEEIFKVSKAVLGWCQSHKAHLSKLSTLNLKEKKLSELPTGILEFLPNLVKLNLYNNHLLSVSAEIKNLKNLKILMIADNHLKEWPEEISTLENLEELNLAQNKISTVGESISKLKNLRQIDLSQNKLNFISMKIGELENLEALVVKDNQLTEVPGEIAKLKKLKILDLSYNYVDPIPHEFKQMKLDYYNDNFNTINNFFKKVHMPALTFGHS